MLLRSLIPTWRFFEEVTELPVLRFRSKADEQSWSEWCSVPVTIPQRRLQNLFVNPDATMLLAVVSLLQAFEGEVQTAPENQRISSDSSVTYEILKNAVEFFYHTKSEGIGAGVLLEFQVLMVLQGDPHTSGAELFRSQPWQMSPQRPTLKQQRE